MAETSYFIDSCSIEMSISVTCDAFAIDKWMFDALTTDGIHDGFSLIAPSSPTSNSCLKIYFLEK